MAAPHETHRHAQHSDPPHAQHSDPSRAQHSGPSQRPCVPIYPASESLATSSSHSQHIPSRSRSGNLTPFLLSVCYSSRMLSLHANRILLIPPLRSPPDSVSCLPPPFHTNPSVGRTPSLYLRLHSPMHSAATAPSSAGYNSLPATPSPLLSSPPNPCAVQVRVAGYTEGRFQHRSAGGKSRRHKLIAGGLP
jgi:hypothetical protein